MFKKKDTPELNRIRIVPMFLLTFLCVAFLAASLVGQRTLAIEYMINSKIVEADIQISEFYEAFSKWDMMDRDLASEFYYAYKVYDKELIGITLKKDDNEVYSVDQPLAKNLYRRTSKIKYSKFVINNNQYYLDQVGNNELYMGILCDFNEKFSMRPLGDTGIIDLKNQTNMENSSRGYQDIWFYYDLGNGYILYIGHTVTLTDYEYQLCFLFSLGFKIAILLVTIMMIIILIRVILSQYRIIKAYYFDPQSMGRNWFYFIEVASKKRSRYERSNNRLALIHLRMEKFYSYCSCYGEEEENKLLREFYQTIKNNLPRNDYFARKDAANFGLAIVFREELELEQLIQKIVEELKTLRPLASLEFKVGAYLTEKGDDIDISEAYNRATIAANSATDRYSGEIIFFSEKMKQDIEWERIVEQDCDRALINREFELYLQPKYSVKEEKFVAAEALIRWNHPTQGFLTPFRFIPIYEKDGMIIRIDDYMISSVARFIAELRSKGITPVPISVNISRAHFIDEQLAHHICKLVDEYRIPHELIELELTESIFFDDKEMIINTTNELRSLGFTVSLDDFGTGYSSLNSLSTLPIDTVKLDQGFFRNNNGNERARITISSIISLAKKLDIKVVAEGIETQEQVDFLANLECDYIQGYFFAKPMASSEFVQIIKDNS